MTPIRLDDLDFSKLTDAEGKFLKTAIEKGPRTWRLGLVLGVLVCVLVISQHQRGVLGPGQSINVGLVKGVGFIVLALWARSWYITPNVLLLLWHLWMNAHLAQIDLISGKILYFGPAIYFAYGAFGCSARRQLLAKAQRSDPASDQEKKSGNASLPWEQNEQSQTGRERIDDLY
jgi:hypothetical protein